MEEEFTKKICRFIYDNFRNKYKSNLEFALNAGIDEKTVRLINQEKYNLSLLKFKQICDSQNIKMSTILQKVGE